jgi:N6-adenosine-specific RNA methylase IME4
MIAPGRIAFRADPRIRDLIPPLAPDELERLEASILAEGIREPLMVWKGCIADGHNRYRIARKHGLNYEYRVLDVETLEECQAWVINNQLGRRNLALFARAELVLKLRDVLAAEAEQRKGTRTDLGATLPPGEAGKTRDKLAKRAGVSGRTMDKVAFLAEHADEETLGKLRSGETTPHTEYKRIRHEQRKAEAVDAVESKPEPLPDGPFDVIVADPPWAYYLRPGDPSHRNQEPYPPMAPEEIAALPVGELAADDAILWLWTTNAHLLDGSAAQVLEAWGFVGKTILTWAKPSMGAGHWLRGQTEHCVMAVRGKPVHELKGQTTLLEAPRREHSRKPDEFFDLVESLCPGSKVELFARERRDGWQSWGAEKGKFDGQESTG